MLYMVCGMILLLPYTIRMASGVLTRLISNYEYGCDPMVRAF